MATKTKAKAKAKKTTQDIPLENIPERSTRRAYSDDFKIAAAKRVLAGESRDHVAAELGISSSMVSNWAKRVREGEPVSNRSGPALGTKYPKGVDGWGMDMAQLKRALQGAVAQRNERLEVAAAIVEFDGGVEGHNLAQHIRALLHKA